MASESFMQIKRKERLAMLVQHLDRLAGKPEYAVVYSIIERNHAKLVEAIAQHEGKEDAHA